MEHRDNTDQLIKDKYGSEAAKYLKKAIEARTLLDTETPHFGHPTDANRCTAGLEITLRTDSIRTKDAEQLVVAAKLGMAKLDMADPPTWDSLRLSPDDWLDQNELWAGNDEDFRRKHAARKVMSVGGSKRRRPKRTKRRPSKLSRSKLSKKKRSKKSKKKRKKTRRRRR